MRSFIDPSIKPCYKECVDLCELQYPDCVSSSFRIAGHNGDKEIFECAYSGLRYSEYMDWPSIDPNITHNNWT